MVKIIHGIIHYVRQNYLFILLSFCILASSVVIVPKGALFYLIGLVYVGLRSIKSATTYGDAKLIIYFAFCCFLSSLVNNVWDVRLLQFILLLAAFTPILNSTSLFIFREKLIFTCLMFFPALSVGALYCYFAGINYFDKTSDEFTYGETGYDFSAFYGHPMWLGASSGIAGVVSTWLFFESQDLRKKILTGALIACSLFICTISGSRSAFASSVLGVLVVVFFFSKDKWVVIKNTFYAIIIALLATPVFMQYSTRMQMKMQNSHGEYGSRTGLFTEGFLHLDDNLFFGTGFASQWRNGHFYVGRLESGSGWLSILFQTGLMGSICMFLILYQLTKIYPLLKCDNKLKLFTCCFFYLCLHSFFEGYILTSGYYLCILFWSILGYIYQYPKMIKGKLVWIPRN